MPGKRRVRAASSARVAMMASLGRLVCRAWSAIQASTLLLNPVTEGAALTIGYSCGSALLYCVTRIHGTQWRKGLHRGRLAGHAAPPGAVNLPGIACRGPSLCPPTEGAISRIRE